MYIPCIADPRIERLVFGGRDSSQKMIDCALSTDFEAEE